MLYTATNRAGLALCILAAAGCHGRAGSAAGPDLQIVGEQTVRSDDPVPAQSPWFDGSRIAITAARGETIGLSVRHRGGGRVAISLADAPAHARLYEVRPVHVRTGSTEMYGGGRGAGDYGDELVASAAPATDPAFVELAIARDAAPGTYRGTLTAGDRMVPISLTVAPVTLPELEPRVWAYYDPRELMWAQLGAGTLDAPSAEERACIAMFRGYGVLLSPDLPASAWPARRALLAGMPVVPAVIPDDPATAGEAVKAWLVAVAGTSQVPFAIPIDEPRDAAARAQVAALAGAVRAAGGGRDHFMYAVTDEPRPEYGDLVDLYISPHAAHRDGDRVTRWTYNGRPPEAGAMVVDAEPPALRTWGWISWRWQIPLWYVWDALYWHDRHNRKGAPLPGRALDAHADATSFSDGDDHGALDGVLALPGDAQTPCRPTLRLAALRRGYEDRALLELAARCAPEEADQLAAKLVPRALGDAPRGSAPAWPRDEAAWEAARQQLLVLAARCK